MCFTQKWLADSLFRVMPRPQWHWRVKLIAVGQDGKSHDGAEYGLVGSSRITQLPRLLLSLLTHRQNFGIKSCFFRQHWDFTMTNDDFFINVLGMIQSHEDWSACSNSLRFLDGRPAPVTGCDKWMLDDRPWATLRSCDLVQAWLVGGKWLSRACQMFFKPF